MTNWQPGMVITAARLNDGIDPTTTTSGFTVASGFSLSNFEIRKSGRVVQMWLELVRTGADITSGTSGNITDTNLGTITNADLLPAHIVEGIISDGFGDGDFNINPSGTVNVRTWSPNGELTDEPPGGGAPPVLRASATWIVD